MNLRKLLSDLVETNSPDKPPPPLQRRQHNGFILTTPRILIGTVCLLAGVAAVVFVLQARPHPTEPGREPATVRLLAAWAQGASEVVEGVGIQSGVASSVGGSVESRGLIGVTKALWPTTDTGDDHEQLHSQTDVEAGAVYLVALDKSGAVIGAPVRIYPTHPDGSTGSSELERALAGLSSKQIAELLAQSNSK